MNFVFSLSLLGAAPLKWLFFICNSIGRLAMATANKSVTSNLLATMLRPLSESIPGAVQLHWVRIIFLLSVFLLLLLLPIISPFFYTHPSFFFSCDWWEEDALLEYDMYMTAALNDTGAPLIFLWRRRRRVFLCLLFFFHHQQRQRRHAFDSF